MRQLMMISGGGAKKGEVQSEEAHLSLTSTGAPVLSASGSVCARRRRLCICIASSAAPLFAVGGCANAWR